VTMWAFSMQIHCGNFPLESLTRSSTLLVEFLSEFLEPFIILSFLSTRTLLNRFFSLYLADPEAFDHLIPPVPDSKDSELAFDQLPNEYVVV